MDAVGVGIRHPTYLQERGNRGGVRARGNDVLFARITPCLENGKVGQLPQGAPPTGGSTEFLVVRPGPSVDPTYLYYWCLEPGTRNRAKTSMSGTTGRMRLSGQALGAFPFPMRSLPEQQRIVEILEDHLSRLDAAQRDLAHADSRMDALLAALLTAVRQGPMRPMSELAQVQGGIQKQPKRDPRVNHFPFLRVANVTSTGLDLRDVHRIELFGDELTRLRLAPGDLLVVEGNGSASQIGRAALWDGSIDDCVHQNHLIRVRPGPHVEPEYLAAVWNSPQTRRELSELSSSSSGLHTLSVSKLKSLHIPVPTRGAQRELLARLDIGRTGLARMDASAQRAVARSSALRRAVLAAAFEGKLTGRHTDAEIIEEKADGER